MSFKKKAAALLTALGIAASFTGCSDTTYGLIVNDTKVPAGIYIYYAMQAHDSALSMLKDENPDFDTADTAAVKASTIEGVDTVTWIQNKATDLCATYVAVEEKFTELGLQLDDEAEANIDDMVEYTWSYYKDFYETNGVSENSYRKLVTSSYKTEEVFLYYYGTEGELGASEEELKEFYIENNMRAEIIKMQKLDGAGNKLEDTSELEALAEDYEERALDAYEEGGIEAVMTEMSEVQSDYKEYCTSISQEAAGVTATTGESTTTTAATEAVTEAATEAGTDASGEAASTTTAAAEADTASTTTTTTTVAETEGTGTGTEATGTTTTTKPFPSETIVAVINEEDYEEGEEITYSPTENVYKNLFDTDEADYGKAFLVEEEDAFYLCVRYDIKERVTEEDLWNESTIYSVQLKMFNDSFDEMLESWIAEMNVERNEAAYKRYDPFNLKTS